MEAKKAAGVKLGRPAGARKLEEELEEIKKLHGLGLKIPALAKHFGVAVMTMRTFLIEKGLHKVKRRKVRR